MIVKEYGSKIQSDCDLCDTSFEQALVSIPNSSDYLLVVPVGSAMDAVRIKETFESKLIKAHIPIRIHVIVDQNTKDIFGWQVFSLLGSVWSPGARYEA